METRNIIVKGTRTIYFEIPIPNFNKKSVQELELQVSRFDTEWILAHENSYVSTYINEVDEEVA